MSASAIRTGGQFSWRRICSTALCTMLTMLGFGGMSMSFQIAGCWQRAAFHQHPINPSKGDCLSGNLGDGIRVVIGLASARLVA